MSMPMPWTTSKRVRQRSADDSLCPIATINGFWPGTESTSWAPQANPLQMVQKSSPVDGLWESSGRVDDYLRAARSKGADLQGFSKATTGIEPV
jgi:hypothetical protein